MKTLLILATVLLILVLIGQIRIGVRALYQDSGLSVWMRLGCFKKLVFPAAAKKNTPKGAKPAKPKEEKPAAEPKPLKERVGGALEYAKELLPLVLEAAAQFRRKLQVDVLRLEVTAGASDPADAAMVYGHAMAILGTLWSPLTETFHIKDGTAKVDLDFNAGSIAVFADISLSLKIGQILWLALHFGGKGLRSFLSVRSKQKEQVRKAA